MAAMNVFDELAANAVWRKDHDAMKLALAALEMALKGHPWLRTEYLQLYEAIDALKERLLTE